jgi:DNA polymerase
MGQAEELAALHHQMMDCPRCDLAKTRTMVVPGEGPADAEIVFVGEAPGANEDKYGRPFIGGAGGLLEDLLKSVGLKRTDVYICNVIKCRPPGNRDPLPIEIEACRPWLDAQFGLLKPLVVCTLGRFSMARWFAGSSISRIHGQAREVDGTWYLPLYHPAAALHQQALRPTLFNDIAQLPALVEKARQQRKTRPAKQSEPEKPEEEPRQLNLF